MQEQHAWHFVGHVLVNGDDVDAPGPQRLQHRLQFIFQHSEVAIDPAAVCMDEKTLMGSYSASVDWQERSAELVFTNRAVFRELISHRFSLEEIGDAFQMASHPADNSLKLVVLP